MHIRVSVGSGLAHNMEDTGLLAHVFELVNYQDALFGHIVRHCF